MSSTTTSSGSVLGAATTAGWLASKLTDWRFALLIAGLILLLGLLIIFFKRRRKENN